MYYLYLLECEDGTIYTGITNDLERRLKAHQEKRGARYTRARGAKRMIHTEAFATKSEALRREIEVKGWTRQEKLHLVFKV